MTPMANVRMPSGHFPVNSTTKNVMTSNDPQRNAEEEQHDVLRNREQPFHQGEPAVHLAGILDVDRGRVGALGSRGRSRSRTADTRCGGSRRRRDPPLVPQDHRLDPRNGFFLVNSTVKNEMNQRTVAAILRP